MMNFQDRQRMKMYNMMIDFMREKDITARVVASVL